MNQEQMEKTIHFLLENQAKFHSDLELMKEAQLRTGEQIQSLTENVEAMRLEMREAFENLIVANEVTRKLTEDVARLAIGTSQRLTKVEEQLNQP